MQEVSIIFGVAVLIMSVVIHEVSHGYVAGILGDQTAKYAGRLTLNPLKHLDIFGSIVVPLLTYFAGGFIFGWAKPVPYNPYNLKNQKWGPGIVAAAGPLSNLLVVGFFSLILRIAPSVAPLPSSFLAIAVSIMFVNITLAVFNLIPLPPLDGSKILFALLPYRWAKAQNVLEKYGFILLLLVIFFFLQWLSPIVFTLLKFFTGGALF